MITLDFQWAITGFLFFFLFLVFMHWLFYTYSKCNSYIHKVQYFVQCPYCTHIFFDCRNQEIQKCPRCQSFISLVRE